MKNIKSTQVSHFIKCDQSFFISCFIQVVQKNIKLERQYYKIKNK